MGIWFFTAVFRVKVLECSAKDDTNVTELFRTIVSLSRVLHIDGNEDSTSGLKRRSSAYVSATSKGQFGTLFFQNSWHLNLLRLFWAQKLHGCGRLSRELSFIQRNHANVTYWNDSVSPLKKILFSYRFNEIKTNICDPRFF